MTNFFCFKCTTQFTLNIPEGSLKRFKNKYGSWEGTKCPSCGRLSKMIGRGSRGGYVVDVPLKGSERYYAEKWFRKDQQTWEADIRSRRSLSSDGSVVGRFNDQGERIA